MNGPIPFLSRRRFRTDKASSRLILLSLAALSPLGHDGTKIDLAKEFDQKGVGAVTEFVQKRRWDAAARGFWPQGVDVPTSLDDSDVLRSHAIDSIAAQMLRNGDVEGFLSARRARLETLVDAFLVNKLEPHGLLRPPLGELIVVDEEGGEQGPWVTQVHCLSNYNERTEHGSKSAT